MLVHNVTIGAVEASIPISSLFKFIIVAPPKYESPESKQKPGKGNNVDANLTKAERRLQDREQKAGSKVKCKGKAVVEAVVGGGSVIVEDEASIIIEKEVQTDERNVVAESEPSVKIAWQDGKKKGLAISKILQVGTSVSGGIIVIATG
jgi:hypothetical protein